MKKSDVELHQDRKFQEAYWLTVLNRSYERGSLAKDFLGAAALFALLFAGLLLTGCGTTVSMEEPPVEKLPYMVTDEAGDCLFIAEPWDTFPNGEPIGIECDAYFESELGAPMTKTEFNERFGNENF